MSLAAEGAEDPAGAPRGVDGGRAPAREGRARGPYRKTAGTREAILNAALEVFAESGFHSGSLRDVARRVGMSNAGVLHHFADKGALLEAMLEQRDNGDADTLRGLSADGRTALAALVQLAATNARKREIVKLFSILSTEATSVDHPAHSHFIHRYAQTRAFVRDAFETLAAQGHLAPGISPASAAIGTLAMMDGLQVQWLLDPSTVEMPEELATYLQTITDVDLTDVRRTGSVAPS
ncbi:TetR/AcrR family transcriptional regulator [Microbacterium sp. SSM24]|uniref:TetR/AcrR family transcriptional regulator n=1 Tax=Microbacterium sp. SSM24 TaxID=2991714 RepID=UPI0022260014|nr:TetR/AcrR family transcriptional regulator [Microbacterium sp. SSM24]MCW3492684.1 TetR/AcrR family transcriptional regulator [Microbacterium sp. SSM24]